MNSDPHRLVTRVCDCCELDGLHIMNKTIEHDECA
jgi:hypothetical protein